MDFNDRLNYYVDLLGCTSISLSKASGVSLASISRYRSGERTPASDSPQIALLAKGIATLSSESEVIATLDEQDVLSKLAADASGIPIEYATFRSNLAALLAAIGFSNSELARSISYDPSYISRIITGSRRPADISAFVDQVATAVGKRFGSPARSGAIANLIDRPVPSISTPDACSAAVRNWLISNTKHEGAVINGFLHTIDTFDIDVFSRSLDYSGLQASDTPSQFPLTRTYNGIQQILEAELDFLRATIASSSMEPVTMYSDMPIGDLSDNPAFARKWLNGIALMLEKGLRLNIIHDIHRPTERMTSAFENWMPLYMTGQITPYCLESPQGSIFKHNIKVSGSVALLGQAIAGHQNEGTFVVTTSKEDVRILSLRARRLLEQAHPLIDIYRADNRDAFQSRIFELLSDGGERLAILSAPPVQTIPDDLLEQLFESNGLDEDSRDSIREHVMMRKDEFVRFLSTGSFSVRLSRLTHEEFDQHPVTLSLSDAFSERDVTYTYEQYIEHIEATQRFADQFEGLTLTVDGVPKFHNLQIVICVGKWALVSKSKSPTIHFIVRNSHLLAAIEEFASLA